ncbi:hypothetical protein KTG15_12775 [Methanobacterium sp. YSL]|nr:hypothetical protein [Methanobacterium sp. YSL]
MKDKIKIYVDHYFRFDRRPDLDHLKAEIISNLSDKYDELIESGVDSEKAYIDVIKSMGDFNPPMDDTVPIEFSELPATPEYTLPTSAIISIFAVIFMFFNTLIGGITTAISIVLYAVGGYYLYAKAMHVKAKQLDIELHKTYLAKIFTYMKTAFFFWTVNLSYLLALIGQYVMKQVILLFKPDMEADPDAWLNFIWTANIASILIFFVAFIVLVIVFYLIYKKLKYQYTLLTGETILKGKVRTSIDFLNEAPSKVKYAFWVVFISIMVGFVPAILNYFAYLDDIDAPLWYWVFTTGLTGFPGHTIVLLIGTLALTTVFIAYFFKKVRLNALPLAIIGYFILFNFIYHNFTYFGHDLIDYVINVWLIIGFVWAIIYISAVMVKTHQKGLLKPQIQKLFTFKTNWGLLSILPVVLYLSSPVQVVTTEAGVVNDIYNTFTGLLLWNVSSLSIWGWIVAGSILIVTVGISFCIYLDILKKPVVFGVNALFMGLLFISTEFLKDAMITRLSMIEYFVLPVALVLSLVYWLRHQFKKTER